MSSVPPLVKPQPFILPEALPQDYDEKKVQAVAEGLEKIAQKQQKLAAKVYSFTPPADKDPNKLDKMRSKLRKYASYLEQLHDAPYGIQHQVAKIEWLRLHVFWCMMQNKELESLMRSPEFAHTREYCLKIVEECKNFAEQKHLHVFTRVLECCSDIFKRFESMTKIQNERVCTLQDDHLKRQILELQVHVFEFLGCRMHVWLTPPTNTSISDKIRAQAEGVLREIGTATYKYLKKEPIPKTSLFLHGELTDVAKGVHETTSDLDRDIKMLCTAEPCTAEDLGRRHKQYKLTERQLAYTLQEARKKLFVSPYPDVRQGLSLGAELTRALSELRQKIRTLGDLLSHAGFSAARANQALKDYVQKRAMPGMLSSELQALYTACIAVRSIQPLPSTTSEPIRRFHTGIAQATEKAIPMYALQTFAEGLTDQIVFEKLIHLESLDDFEVPAERSVLYRIPTILQAYLQKACLQWLFFAQPNIPRPPILDVIFFFLETYPEYGAFKKTLELDIPFQNIVTSYKKYPSLIANTSFLEKSYELACKIAACKAHQKDRYAAIFYYSQACMLYMQCNYTFNTIEGSFAEEMKRIFIQILSLAKKKIETMRGDFPSFREDFFDKIGTLDSLRESREAYISILFSALSVACANADQKHCEERDKLHAYLSHAFLPEIQETKFLLGLFVLQLHERKTLLQEKERHILEAMLIEYVNNPNLAATYQTIQGTRSMECLLFEQRASFKHLIMEKRGEDGYEVWEKGISYVDGYKRTREPKWIEWLIDLLQKSGTIREHYLAPLRQCLEEMKSIHGLQKR